MEANVEAPLPAKKRDYRAFRRTGERIRSVRATNSRAASSAYFPSEVGDAIAREWDTAFTNGSHSVAAIVIAEISRV